MLKRTAIWILCASSTIAISRADTTSVAFDSGNGGAPRLFDQNNTALSAGTTADGDGFVLQLGYFTGANFTGTFVPLSGQGSANTGIVPGSNDAETYNKTSIGDLNLNFQGSGFTGSGAFALQLDFTVGDPTTGNNLPANGTPLAIRFYNGTTIAGSTAYNTVSSTATNWQWATPSTPPTTLTLSLDDPGLVWESIVRFGQASNTAFHTTIVPEPTTITSFVVGSGLLALAVARRRRA